eukprot:14436198-Ditylum_brightwellii.AAC.1
MWGLFNQSMLGGGVFVRLYGKEEVTNEEVCPCLPYGCTGMAEDDLVDQGWKSFLMFCLRVGFGVASNLVRQ